MSRDRSDDREQAISAESPTMTEGPEAATEGFGAGEAPLVVGQNLGGRYQVVGRLGAGGMGEVWRAFDLKLRVEVALKALREDLFKNEKRLELLRQEVRAAREVVSPNVCRIFDLVEADGRELVSMEYVDGQTLLGVLQERGPLELHFGATYLKVGKVSKKTGSFGTLSTLRYVAPVRYYEITSVSRHESDTRIPNAHAALSALPLHSNSRSELLTGTGRTSPGSPWSKAPPDLPRPVP